MSPRLIVVAHGTRYPEGPRTVELLMRRVKRRLPYVNVHTSYLELVEPSLTAVMGGATAPVVVVPLLLSTGHHITRDLPEAARASAHPVALARSLGPHPLLAAAMGTQLRAAGATRGDAVVMVAAGSNDVDALVDTHAAGRMLEAHWGAPVKVAHLSGRGRRVDEVMQAMRRDGHRRVAVAPYLLFPGDFARRAQGLAQTHGACATSDVLGQDQMVVELVLQRYQSAARRWSGRTVPNAPRVA